MARYAMIHAATGFVVNVIEWDGDESRPDSWHPPAGHIMVLDTQPTAGPGWTYANGKFNPPPSFTPPEVKE